jgi:signal transduction histidine kinase
MSMRRLFRRSILWLLPVVIVPLGLLFVMQMRFLRDLEKNTASAQRNSLRNSLEQATAEIENRFRLGANAALSLSDAELYDVENVGKRFASAQIPGGRTYFAVTFKGHMSAIGWFDAWGHFKIPTEAEVEAVKMTTASWQFAHKMWRVADPTLHVDERDPRHRIILRPVVDSSLHVVGVAGVILDDGLAKAAMHTIGRQMVQNRRPDKPLAFRVADRFPRPVDGEFITLPLGFVYTNWRAGVRDLCQSPEDMAAMQFKHNMMWTGGAFFVLLGAVGLSIGAVARQVRLSEMKSDFVSNVSHELRTPLSSIRVFGEYMRLGRVEKPEKVQQYGEYIEAESRRLTQLINNILDFSKIESAEKKYRFCETDLAALVEQTVNAFAVPLRDAGVTIAFETDGRAPMLHVDRDAIGQVLMNLLDNAVKYSNGNKNIEVRVASSAREVRIGVHDHGIGIPASEQKKIFEKFYRVGSTLVHDVKGSGLGLSIVKHVVEAHGGRVELVSVPGDGSTFTLVLPIAQPQQVPATTTEFA